MWGRLRRKPLAPHRPVCTTAPEAAGSAACSLRPDALLPSVQPRSGAPKRCGEQSTARTEWLAEHQRKSPRQPSGERQGPSAARPPWCLLTPAALSSQQRDLRSTVSVSKDRLGDWPQNPDQNQLACFPGKVIVIHGTVRPAGVTNCLAQSVSKRMLAHDSYHCQCSPGRNLQPLQSEPGACCAAAREARDGAGRGETCGKSSR